MSLLSDMSDLVLDVVLYAGICPLDTRHPYLWAFGTKYHDSS